MAAIVIYDRSGSRKVNSNGDYVVGKMKYVGAFQKVSYVEFTISSPFPIDWKVGDYVDWGEGLIYGVNIRFYLFSLPQPNKIAERGRYGDGFRYTVQFHDASKMIELALFTDMQVEGDNLVHYSNREGLSTFENLEGIGARIQACLRFFVSSLPSSHPLSGVEVIVWVNTDPSPGIGNENAEAYMELIEDAREFSLEGTVEDALNRIGDVWPTIGWECYADHEYRRLVVYIGYSNFVENASYTDCFSRHNGLVSIKKYITNAAEFFTQLIAYGSDRNMISRYYNGKTVFQNDGILNGQSNDLPRLMIPISAWGKTSGKWDLANTSESARLLPDARKTAIGFDYLVNKYGAIPRVVAFNKDKDGDIYPSLFGMTIGDLWAVMRNTEENYPRRIIWHSGDRLDLIKSADAIGDLGIFADDGSDYQYEVAITTAGISGGGGYTIQPGSTIPGGGFIPLRIAWCDTAGHFKSDVVLFMSDFYMMMKPVDGLQYHFAAWFRIRNAQNTIINVKEINLDDRIESYIDEDNVKWLRVRYSSLSYIGFLEYAEEAAYVEIVPIFEATNITSDPISLPSNFFKGAQASGRFINSSTLSATTHVQIPQVGFNIKDRMSDNDAYGTLNMKKGMCAGRSFKIVGVNYKQNTDTWDLEIERVADDSTGMVYPNDTYPIQQGDEYVLTEIQMPEIYLKSAEQRLLDAALKYYVRNARPRFLYDLEVDSLWIRATGQILRPAIYMQINDQDLLSSRASCLIPFYKYFPNTSANATYIQISDGEGHFVDLKRNNGELLSVFVARVATIINNAPSFFYSAHAFASSLLLVAKTEVETPNPIVIRTCAHLLVGCWGRESGNVTTLFIEYIESEQYSSTNNRTDEALSEIADAINDESENFRAEWDGQWGIEIIAREPGVSFNGYDTWIEVDRDYVDGDTTYGGSDVASITAKGGSSGTQYVLIDTVTITENDSNIPTFKVTLREKLYLPE